MIVNCRAGGSCQGGNPGGVYEYAKEAGIPDQTCQQYVASNGDGQCSPSEICETCHPTNGSFSPGQCDAVQTYETWKVSEYGGVAGADKMKAEIYKRGPLGCGVHATQKFEEYKGGIFSEHVDWPIINHEISVVGWGYDSDSQTEYWVGRNSWGCVLLVRPPDF